jgi:hypothetical protein
MQSRTARAFSSAFLGSALLAFLPACILVVDGDSDWDASRWHAEWSGKSSIRGSGVAKTETRTITDFKKIEMNGGCDLSITVGGATSLTLTADDNLLQYVVTEVRDGTLVFEMKPGSYSSAVHMKAYVTVPAIEGVVVRGSGDVDLTGLSGDRFEYRVDGSGDAKASGKVGTIVAKVSGSGDLNFSDVEAREATVEISGSGDVDVWATESLAVSVAGSGDVTYKGEPAKLTKSVAGSGSVRKR